MAAMLSVGPAIAVGRPSSPAGRCQGSFSMKTYPSCFSKLMIPLVQAMNQFSRFCAGTHYDFGASPRPGHSRTTFDGKRPIVRSASDELRAGWFGNPYGGRIRPRRRLHSTSRAIRPGRPHWRDGDYTSRWPKEALNAFNHPQYVNAPPRSVFNILHAGTACGAL
jgi:hypothetical protein